MATTWKKKARETERYMGKDGVEGAKTVRLGELGGRRTSGEAESRMEEFC